MRKIKTESDLKDWLGISEISELQDPENQRKLVEKAKEVEIAPELIRGILRAIPELATAFTEVVKAMKGIGVSLEETKRLRWEVLQQIAASGVLSGDQVLEAMGIIQEIEQGEGIDWESVFKTAFKVLGAIAVLIVFILSRGQVKPKL